MTFKKGTSGNPAGRKPNVVKQGLSKRLENLAMKRFEAALEAGEVWAIKEVLKRKYPVLKAQHSDESVGHQIDKQKYVSAVKKMYRDEINFK